MSPVPPAVPFWSTFTAFDWLITALLLWSVVAALRRGAIREIVALTGLIAGLLLASWNYPRLTPYLEPWLHAAALANVAAFLLILSVVTVAASLLGRLLRSGAHAVGLGLLDRLAGAGIGLVRGLLLGTAVMLAVTAFLPPQPAVAQSRLAPYLLAAAHGVSFVVPQGLEQQLTLGAAALMHTRTARVSSLTSWPPGYNNQGHGSNQDPK